MGTVLVARMASLFKNHEHAPEVARQQIGFAKRLIDPTDGLGYHGYNNADGHETCCKWGRANGWGMLGHAQALESRIKFPGGYPDPKKNQLLDTIFQQHAAAFMASQAEDGHWHQLMNDAKSFLETSTTAMAITALVRGVHAWRPAS